MPAVKTVKNLVYIGMPDGAILAIGKQILLAYIGGVIAIGIFGQQMIERLVFFWPCFGGNRIIPFIGIIEFGININNDAAKRIQPVPYYRANAEFCILAVHYWKNPMRYAQLKFGVR